MTECRQTLITTVELITPEIAGDLLAANPHNRNVRAPIVARYARDMAAGRWALNHQAIGLSTSGEVLDGQHRLYAVIQSNTPVLMLVTRGLEDRAIPTIDVGMARRPGDVLGIAGEANANALAAACKLLWAYQRYGRWDSVHSARPSSHELFQVLEENPQLRDAVRGSRQALIPPSLSAVLWVLFGQKDAQLRDYFFLALGDGIGLGGADPVYVLREKLSANRTARAKLGFVDIAHLIIQTWNLTRMNRQIRVLRIPDKSPEIM